MVKHKYVGRYTHDGTHSKHNGRKKLYIILISIGLLLSTVVGNSLAYIMTRTDHVQNQFTPASVSCRVNSSEDTSFDVTNTGNVDAYIRAAIVINWMDEQGNVRGIAPLPEDYTLKINDSHWEDDTDTGFYYYKQPVAPGGTTEGLVASFAISKDAAVPVGYALCAEVVAEAIQAEGNTDDGAYPAYQDAWGISSISGS